MKQREPKLWYLKFPRLHAKCTELMGGDECAGRILTHLVVETRPGTGVAGFITDGERIALTPEMKAMKLHELMSATH